MSKGRPDTPHSDSSSDDVHGPSRSHSGRSSVTGYVAAPFSENHRLLKMRLSPLRRIQKDLERRLGTSVSGPHSASETPSESPYEQSPGRRSLQEFCIHSTNGWKTALDRFRPDRDPRMGAGPTKKGRNTEIDEITEVILGCSQDIKAIWHDPTLRSVLGERKLQMEESPGL
jgi:guanine nucleotide-binding protein alpha-1 subunit